MQTKTLVKWEEKTLGDLITLEYGKGLDKVDRKAKGKYPAYGANGVKDWTDKYLYDKKTIIVGRKGSAGEINFTEEKFWALDVTYYAVFDEKILDLNFLYFILTTLNLPSLANGIKPGINRNDVYAIPVKIPPLEEQQRIVEVLDKAFEDIDLLTENAKQNLQNAKILFENYLEQIFSQNEQNWNEKTLSQIGLIQTGTTPKTSEKENFGDYIPFIKPADFYKDGSLNYDNDGLSEMGIKKSRLVKEKSVLMVCIGATIGKTGYTEQDITCNQQINALTPNKDYYKFLYYAMIRKNFQSTIIDGCPQTTLPIINKTNWSNLKIKLPDIDEQITIAKKLDNLLYETKQLEQIYQQKIQQAEELKQSILQKAFNGEL